MSEAAADLTPEQIATAFRNHYTPPKPGGTCMDTAGLIELLRTLPSLSVNDHVDTIMVQLKRHHRGLQLDPKDCALLNFVDDSITHVLRQTDLDFKIESFVRDLAPFVAIAALSEGVHATTRPRPVLSMIDTLMRECIGWSEDLGILGEQFMAKLEAIIKPAVNVREDIAGSLGQLQTLFKKEGQVWETMEERLRHAEVKVLAGQKARYYATDLLNKQMAGTPLPLFMIFMLQGSWFEFLQQVFVHYGLKSAAWEKAEKLTEALVWSLHPQEDRKKHESIMSTLPDRIRSFCEQLDFDTTPFEDALADVEGEYEAIRSGSPSDPCDFELMAVDESMSESGRPLDEDILAQVEAFEPGQWFLYDDKRESDERIARIKLILNWSDTQRLLFTNQNRRKVLHMSYGELAERLSNKTVRTLTPKNAAHEIIKAHLFRILQSVGRQKKREKQVAETSERKVITQEYLSKRRAALDQAVEQHRKVAAAKEKRAKILRHKADQKLEAANAAVASLRMEAWVKLPIMEGTLTPCKLVAIIAASDKYIFANRAGIKVAEYTSSQLAHMIVTENSEILDTGAEFEGVLASVVSGLREDRNKSYEELTGNTA